MGEVGLGATFRLAAPQKRTFSEIPKVANKNVQNLHSKILYHDGVLASSAAAALLGTGMQSICKFSLLCRVCKCSSIWLLSIFFLFLLFVAVTG